MNNKSEPFRIVFDNYKDVEKFREDVELAIFINDFQEVEQEELQNQLPRAYRFKVNEK